MLFPVFDNIAAFRLVCNKKSVVFQGQNALSFEFKVEMVLDFSMKLLFTFITQSKLSYQGATVCVGY